MVKYPEFEYLQSLGLHVVKPGLDRIIKVLESLGNPQNDFNTIVIAGTNGKGSVASILYSILLHNGLRAGLYTSPHLIRINERISCNGEYIPDDRLRYYIRIIKGISENNNIDLSYFELLTTIAFLYFRDLKIDIAVLEVGMGGRWDATNVVNPLVSVITNVSFDHMEYLGNNLEEIAEEKAQIIKFNRPVVTACDEQGLLPIKRKAIDCSSELYIYGTDFFIECLNNDYFSYKGIHTDLREFKTNLVACYQVCNIGISLAVIDVIKYRYDIVISDNHIRTGLMDIKWKGRFDIFGKKNKLLLDCAHNENSAAALVSSIKKIFPGQKFNFLIGMLNDKKHANFIKIVSIVSNKIFITDGFSEREIAADKLGIICKNLEIEHEIICDYRKALNYLVNYYNPLCITGSIYLIGAVLGKLYDYKIH